MTSARVHRPFDIATLASLYPSHAACVDAVTRVTLDHLARGYILKPDANAIIEQAVQSRVGGTRAKDLRAADR